MDTFYMFLQLLVSGCCMPLLTCYLILSHSMIITINCFKNAIRLYDFTFSEPMTSSKQSISSFARVDLGHARLICSSASMV